MSRRPQQGAARNGSSAATEDFSPAQASAALGRGVTLFFRGVSPGQRACSLRMEQGEAVIGRDDDCDLTIEHASVSRRHVRLEVQPDGILVEDLNSTNGTHYLERRIERLVLHPGARITVGHCEVDLLPLAIGDSATLSTSDRYEGLFGRSTPMRQLYTMLELMESSEAPVLIEGETGTGKELAAQALHRRSPRAQQPFIVIDCGTVPAELMESELFGHRKGAFTGAVADRTGSFAQAHGGTIFLDELGEMPLALQPKLLRVLETGQVKRVGDSSHQETDVRVIAATQRDLEAEVAAGRFRQDLFYRVAVVRLRTPPLRERREDIPVLAAHLARQLGAGTEAQLPEEALELFLGHSWPGNVRELRNAVQRVLSLGLVGLELTPGSPPALHADTAPDDDPSSPPGPYRRARDRALSQFERRYLSWLWRWSAGNLSQAAREAGVDRKYLRTLLRRHELIE